MAAPAPAAIWGILGVDAGDHNGDLYIGSSEGEVLDRSLKNRVIFRAGDPRAANPFDSPAFTHNQLVDFLAINTALIYSVNDNITPSAAAQLAYLRFCLARDGLISPAFATAANHVRYNDAVDLPVGTTVQQYLRTELGDAAYNLRQVALPVAVPDPIVPGGGAVGAPVALDEAIAVNAILGCLSGPVRKVIRDHTTDIVCMVAFMFRQRGHHFLDDFQERYENIWQRCRYDPAVINNMGGWRMVSTVGVHAIFPIVLDTFYVNSVGANRCNGALKKRVDVAAAGTAIVKVVIQGYNDLSMVFPNVGNRVPGAVQYLDQLKAAFAGADGRWLASVNKHYYGVANPLRVDESILAPIASAIAGAYDSLSTGGTLQTSPALKRVANQAPIVKAVLGRAAQRAANDERLTLME